MKQAIESILAIAGRFDCIYRSCADSVSNSFHNGFYNAVNFQIMDNTTRLINNGHPILAAYYFAASVGISIGTKRIKKEEKGMQNK